MKPFPLTSKPESRIIHGTLDHPFSTLTEGIFTATFGYLGPDEMRMSLESFKTLFLEEMRDGLMDGFCFRDARFVRDETVPLGVVEFRTTAKMNNPLYQSTVIFDDWSTPTGKTSAERSE